MRTISQSPRLLLVLPVLMFIVVPIVFFAKGLISGQMAVPALVVMLIMFILYFKAFTSLADEVKDGGTFLMVRKGSVEDRVQLEDVIGVVISRKYWYLRMPPILSLQIRCPGRLGSDIEFVPRRPLAALVASSDDPVAEDLMQRADRARSGTR